MATMRLALMPCVIALVLFISAGRVDLPLYWAYVGMLVFGAAVAACALDRELLAERVRPAAGGEDRAMRFLALPFIAAHLVIAGLDCGRFGWSRVPQAAQAAALAGVALGYGLSIWAMIVNRFFSPVVRIQSERGHTLVTRGPYRWVRHPGYAGALAAMLLGGPALGSWWAGVCILPVIALMLRRTALEDRYLAKHLPGYAAYAGRVRWRLAPGVY